MNKILSILFAFVLISATSFSQYLVVDTAFTTDPGLGGAPASCIWSGGTGYGSTASISTGFSIADDFSVPVGQSWRIDSVRVYAYQTGSTTTSTFTDGRIKIWRGRPDSVGATLVFADTLVSAIKSTRWSGVYRVSSTTLTNTQRPVMLITLNAGGTVLTAGSYWIEYWLNGSIASGPFTPAKVLPGRVNPPNQNGMQKTFATNTWAATVDPAPTTIGFNLMVMGSNVTAVGNNNEIPNKFELKQNYPNPFNPSTSISFDMPKTGYAKLTVFNSLGQVVATLVDGEINAGTHDISFNASNLASGVYMYKLEAGEFTDTKKMTLVK